MLQKTLILISSIASVTAECAYPTFSAASGNILKAEEYTAFVKKHPFFIVGVTDAKCKECCESEELLVELDEMSRNGTLTWTHSPPKKKNKKQKPPKTTPIPIMRADTSNKHDKDLFLQEGLKID